MIKLAKIIYRTFILNDFFSTIASSWAAATIFLTIVAGFSAGVVGLAADVTPLSFVPPLLATLSPYLVTITVCVGIFSYVASLFATYANEQQKYEDALKERLEDVMDAQELKATENTQTSSEKYTTLCQSIQREIINSYQVATGYLIGRSIDRANRLFKIQLTKRLLDTNDVPEGTTKASILRGCIQHQSEGAAKHHSSHSFWAAYLTTSNFVNACNAVLGDCPATETEKTDYINFFKQNKEKYKNIKDNHSFTDRLNNLEPTGNAYTA